MFAFSRNQCNSASLSAQIMAPRVRTLRRQCLHFEPLKSPRTLVSPEPARTGLAAREHYGPRTAPSGQSPRRQTER